MFESSQGGSVRVGMGRLASNRVGLGLRASVDLSLSNHSVRDNNWSVAMRRDFSSAQPGL